VFIIFPIIFVLFTCGILAGVIGEKQMPFNQAFWMGALLGPLGILIIAVIVLAKGTPSPVVLERRALAEQAAARKRAGK
jgi:pilus assembly protein TadC